MKTIKLPVYGPIQAYVFYKYLSISL